MEGRGGLRNKKVGGALNSPQLKLSINKDEDKKIRSPTRESWDSCSSTSFHVNSPFSCERINIIKICKHKEPATDSADNDNGAESAKELWKCSGT